MGKHTTTRTVTTTVVVQQPRTFPAKVIKQAAGAAILIGIGIVAAR